MRRNKRSISSTIAEIGNQANAFKGNLHHSHIGVAREIDGLHRVWPNVGQSGGALQLELIVIVVHENRSSLAKCSIAIDKSDANQVHRLSKIEKHTLHSIVGGRLASRGVILDYQTLSVVVEIGQRATTSYSRPRTGCVQSSQHSLTAGRAVGTKDNRRPQNIRSVDNHTESIVLRGDHR